MRDLRSRGHRAGQAQVEIVREHDGAAGTVRALDPADEPTRSLHAGLQERGLAFAEKALLVDREHGPGLA